jgi:hypothetical protein
MPIAILVVLLLRSAHPGQGGSSAQLLGGKIESGKQYHGDHQHHDKKPEALAPMGLTLFTIYEAVKHGNLPKTFEPASSDESCKDP